MKVKNMGMMTDQMRGKLATALSPQSLDLVDESEKHRGHAGYRDGGESHFRLTVVSAVFEGLSRLERQRRINEVLAEELAGPVHALSIRALTPGEAA